MNTDEHGQKPQTNTDRSGVREVKLPSGKVVMLGPKHGHLAMAVDVAFAGKTPPEREWAWAELMARRVKTLDGKPVVQYGYVRFLADFDDRDQRVLVAVAARMDIPTPEEYAEALKGSGLLSAEALDESVALYRLSGGAIPFDQAMEFDEKTRKWYLASFIGRYEKEKETERATKARKTRNG